MYICFKFVFFKFHVKINFRFRYSFTKFFPNKCPCEKCEALRELYEAEGDTKEAAKGSSEAVDDSDKSVNDSTDEEDEYLQQLCYMEYGISLTEYRALVER